MIETEREQRRDQIKRAAVMSAIIGPLTAQILVGALARMQNFFCPANFLPIYAVSFTLLAPGFFLIGLAGAETAMRLGERAVTRWQTLALLPVGGAILGAAYFQSLSVVLGWIFPDYSVMLTMPGLGAALAMAAALATTWSVLSRRAELSTLSLR